MGRAIAGAAQPSAPLSLLFWLATAPWIIALNHQTWEYAGYWGGDGQRKKSMTESNKFSVRFGVWSEGDHRDWKADSLRPLLLLPQA